MATSEIQGEASQRTGSVKYIVCPGRMKSKNDGQWHYIGVAALVRLYELRHGEWITWEERHGYDLSQMTCLYPSYEGHYGRPD